MATQTIQKAIKNAVDEANQTAIEKVASYNPKIEIEEAIYKETIGEPLLIKAVNDTFKEYINALINTIIENDLAFFIYKTRIPDKVILRIIIANRKRKNIEPIPQMNNSLNSISYLIPNNMDGFNVMEFSIEPNPYSKSIYVKITIGNGIYKKILYNNKEIFAIAPEKEKSVKYSINEKNEWYGTTLIKGNYKNFPVNIKDILKTSTTYYFFPQLEKFIKNYLKECLPKNKALKDIIKQIEDGREEGRSLILPYTINYLVKNYKNNVQTIADNYKRPTLQPLLNKTDLETATKLSKILSKIPKNYHADVINANIKNSGYISKIKLRFVSQILAEAITNYFAEKLKNQPSAPAYMDRYLIYDFVTMSLDQKEKINFAINSYNRIREEHNRLVRIADEKRLAEVIIPKNSPFKKLVMPKDIILLDTKIALIDESEFNHNCVKTYIDRINNGECIIYSYRPNLKERYTTEIILNKEGEFKAVQIRGFANDLPNKEIVDYIKAAVNKNNDKSLKQ